MGIGLTNALIRRATAGIDLGVTAPGSPAGLLVELDLETAGILPAPKVAAIDHAAGLSNLGADSHGQYVHNTVARAISAVHTFNPVAAGAPFVLGGNAQGQVVAGLNADQVDGNEATALLARANHTGTQAPATIVPQGAASGLDADTVDGSEASALLARTNHTGVQTPATISPQGTGSGLDADTVDGLEATAFATAVHTHAAADVTSGTFSDARISQSSVTQHQAAIDHDQLLNFTAAEHRIINDAGTSTTELLSSSTIRSLVSAATSNLDIKDSVVTVATANVVLSGEQTINGVLTSTSRIGVVGQTSPAENGIYATAAGAWTRATDADSDAEVTNGLSFFVSNSGSTKNGNQYILITADPIVLDTTGLTFTEVPRIVLGTTSGTAAEGSDTRIPTQDENDALVGNTGAPSAANKYLTAADITATVASSSHRATHVSGGSDAFLAADLLEAIVKRLQESGGPTNLTLGTVADGQFLKRVGSTIVGSATGGNTLGQAYNEGGSGVGRIIVIDNGEVFFDNRTVTAAPKIVRIGYGVPVTLASTPQGFEVDMRSNVTAGAFDSVAMTSILPKTTDIAFQVLTFSTNAVWFGDGDLVLGGFAMAGTERLLVLGESISCPDGTNSERFGTSAVAAGTSSVAMGRSASAAGNDSVAVGRSASASGFDAVAIGRGANATNPGVVIGTDASISAGGNSVVIGRDASSAFADTIVLGRQATSTATQQFVAGSNGAITSAVYFGRGVVNASPAAYTIHGTGGSGTDVAGASVSIAGGQGTGTGTGGSVFIKTAPAGGTGSTPNALVTRIEVDDTGLVAITGSLTVTEGNLLIPSTKTTGVAWVNASATGTLTGSMTGALFDLSVLTAGANRIETFIIGVPNSTNTGTFGLSVQTLQKAGDLYSGRFLGATILSGTLRGINLNLTTFVTAGSQTVDGLVVSLPSDGAGVRRTLVGDNAVIFRDGTLGVGTLTEFGSGAGVIGVANAATAPTTNPTGGGVLYAEGGAGKWRGSSGTITTFGPAEPHCRRCGRDFAHAWENPKYGKLSICNWCLVEALEGLGLDVAIEKVAA